MKSRIWTRFSSLVACILVGAGSAMALPLGSGYYFMSTSTNYPPLQINPYPMFQVYWLGGNAFLVDDRSVDYFAVPDTSSDTVPDVGGGGATNGSGGVSFPQISFGSNDLWLEITPTNVATTNVGPNTNTVVRTNAMARLTLHGTVPG